MVGIGFGWGFWTGRKKNKKIADTQNPAVIYKKRRSSTQ
jgi:hypothetical protein